MGIINKNKKTNIHSHWENIIKKRNEEITFLRKERDNINTKLENYEI